MLECARSAVYEGCRGGINGVRKKWIVGWGEIVSRVNVGAWHMLDYATWSQEP
jgi:hypothetical protein